MRIANDGKRTDLAFDNLVAMKERSPLLRASRPQSLGERQTTLDDADAAPEIARCFRLLRRMQGPLIAHLRRRRGLI